MGIPPVSRRDTIIDRLRQAHAAPVPLPPPPAPSQTYRDLPPSDAPLAETFTRRLEALAGQCHRVPDLAAAAGVLTNLIQAADVPALAQTGPLVDAVIALLPPESRRPDRLAILDVTAQPTRQSNAHLAHTAVGITEAACLVARTAGVVLTAAQGGRRLSAMPPTHVVLARTAAIVPDLSDALARTAPTDICTIIHGPSRTADIEKNLVLGAHGPERLVVILIEA